MQEKIFLNDGNNNKICAIISKSEKTNSKSIVIMCHGLNSSKESKTNLDLEKIFLENKIDTIRFDLYAHGESEGDIKNRSVDKFVNNIIDVISHVKGLGYHNIGLFGSSFGGLSSVIAASKRKEIKVLALKAPGMGKISRTMENYKKDSEDKIWISAGKNIRAPTLIVHGTADLDVELRLSEELSDSTRGSILKIFEGSDHKFTRESDFKKMIEAISEFILLNIEK